MENDLFLSEVLSFFKNESWIAQVFLVVFITVFFDWIQKRILNKLYARLEKTRTYWDDALIDAIRRPLSALIWIIGLTFAAEIVRNESGAVIFEAIGPIRDVGVIVAFAWFLVRFITRAEQNIIGKRTEAGEKIDRTTADAIAKLLRM